MLIRNIFIYKTVPYIVVGISIILFIMSSKNPLPFMLDLVPLALFAYSFGNIFRSVEQLFNRNIVAIIAISGMLSIVIGAFLNVRVSYTQRVYGNVIYFLVAGIFGIIFFVLLFSNIKLLRNNKILQVLGKNSLIIMAAQYWIFRILNVISRRFIGFPIWGTGGTVKALISLIITIGLMLIL